VFDAFDMGKLFLSTENTLGTSGWSSVQFEFKTKADTRLLVVRVARPASEKLDNQISGTVWIDRVSLTPEKLAVPPGDCAEFLVVRSTVIRASAGFYRIEGSVA